MMKAATMFSGVGAPELAMPDWDWLWHAEVDPFASAVMAARARSLKTPVIECVFEDWKQHPDEGRVVGFLAKYARGLMARYIITQGLDRVDGLKDFDVERYKFQPARSTDERWIYSRRFIPVQTS